MQAVQTLPASAKPPSSTLCFCCRSISADGITALQARCPGLQALSLAYVPLSSAAVRAVARMPRLRCARTREAAGRACPQPGGRIVGVLAAGVP